VRGINSLREACNLANSGINPLNAVLNGTRFSRGYSDAGKITLTSGSDVLSSLSKCVVTAWGGSTDTFEPGVNGLDDGGVGGGREDINCVEDVQTFREIRVRESIGQGILALLGQTVER